jgi:hypothetical protein
LLNSQNVNDNLKLKLSLNDLTTTTSVNKTPTAAMTPKLANNINRTTTSSMSISTFSPRTTQNNSTNQFTELVDEKYNRSEYLTNANNDGDVVNQLQKSLSVNGLSYNNINLNSNSSFLLKSKDNFNEDIAAFNKYTSKYNSNITYGNTRSPREKRGSYLYVSFYFTVIFYILLIQVIYLSPVSSN